MRFFVSIFPRCGLSAQVASPPLSFFKHHNVFPFKRNECLPLWLECTVAATWKTQTHLVRVLHTITDKSSAGFHPFKRVDHFSFFFFSCGCSHSVALCCPFVLLHPKRIWESATERKCKKLWANSCWQREANLLSLCLTPQEEELVRESRGFYFRGYGLGHTLQTKDGTTVEGATVFTPPPPVSIYSGEVLHKRFVDRAKRIDTISRAFFPLSFLIFNIFYWITYKVLRHEDIHANL